MKVVHPFFVATVSFNCESRKTASMLARERMSHMKVVLAERVYTSYWQQSDEKGLRGLLDMTRLSQNS